MIRKTLTMIPGPTPVHDAVLEALARPTLSHQDPNFTAAYASALRRLQQVTYGEDAQPFIVGGAGTLAMEMALLNLLGPEDRLLIVSHGYFGDRYVEMAAAFGIDHEVLRAESGHAVSVEQVTERLGAGGFAAMACTHVDTSTGVAAPVEALARAARHAGALTIVDGVCATAGMEERVDDWAIDVLFTGAQKALGAPPGVGLLVVSQQAMQRRRALGTIRAYYADWMRWLPIMEAPAKYFSTPPVNEIAALDVALGLILDEGMTARFERHRRMARGVRAGLAAIGIEPFTDAGCRGDTLTVALYPDGIDDAGFRAAMAERRVVVAGALGPIAGKAFRIGHMGFSGDAEILQTLQAVESSLEACGGRVADGAATAAAAPHLIGAAGAARV